MVCQKQIHLKLLIAVLLVLLGCTKKSDSSNDEDEGGGTATASGSKLESSDCVDPDLTKLEATVQLTLCDGSTAYGLVKACEEDGELNCITDDTYKPVYKPGLDPADLIQGTTILGVEGTSVLNPPNCSANGETGCITTASYPSVDPEKNPNALLKSKLLAHWSMDEVSTGVANVVRADSNGQLDLPDINMTPSAAGKLGNALSIADGSTDYMELASTYVNFGSEDFSMAFWFNANSAAPGWQIIAGIWDDTTPHRSFFAGMNFSAARFHVTYNGNTGIGLANSSAISGGVWYFLVVTFNSKSGAANIYFNGVLEGTNTTSLAGDTAVHYDANTHFRIGRGTVSDEPFDGLVDELSIWNGKFFHMMKFNVSTMAGLA